MPRPLGPAVAHLQPGFDPKVREILAAAVEGREPPHPVPDGLIVDPAAAQKLAQDPIQDMVQVSPALSGD